MKEFIKNYLRTIWQSAVDLNEKNIRSFIRYKPGRNIAICDLGCGTGELVATIRERELWSANTTVTVVEQEQSYHPSLEQLGYIIVPDDLNKKLTIQDNSSDIVLSNQVIEHLYDTEQFLEECVRITKPGGIVIVSTENPAAWHNIAALIIGWQMFSLSNMSRKVSGIGNPMSLAPTSAGWIFGMQHHRLYTPKALKQAMELAGLERVQIKASGYHPFPAALGNIDKNHGAFITLCGQKPSK